MNTIAVEHQFSYGHRLFQHRGACRNLHGHNARVIFEIGAETLDHHGMVIDFKIIKTTLCRWLDENWDHRFLIFSMDPFYHQMKELDGVIPVGFNPTAENLATYLLREVAPNLLNPFRVEIRAVHFYETEKNFARIAG